MPVPPATSAPPTTLPEVLDNPAGRFLTDPISSLAELGGSLLEVTLTLARSYGPWLVALGLATVAARIGLGRWRLARLHERARLVEILLPPTVDPSGAGELWRNLAGLLRQRRWLEGRPHASFEYHWTGDRLTIGLWLPGMVPPRLVEHAIQAAWPGAHTRTHTPPPPLLPAPEEEDRPVSVAGGSLRLARAQWWSLRTEPDTDPLRAIFAAAAEHAETETTSIQILARPARASRLSRCYRAARALRQGQSPTRTGRLLSWLTPGPSRSPHAYSQDPARAGEVRAILGKAADQPAWETTIRYAVATTTQHHAGGRLRSRAHALAAAFAVYAGRNQLTRRRLHQPARTLARRPLAKGDLLGLSELAALAHLPYDQAVAGLDRAGARAVAPVAAVSRTGKLLGDADAGPARPVALIPADARQHLHVMGATGSGKSTLLANLLLQDVHAGRGAILIDPRGDLVRDLLDRLPADVGERLVLLDPDDRTDPPALGMLEGPDPEQATEHLLGIFRRIFAAAWGPRTDDVLRAACLSLLAVGPASLSDVPKLLTQPGFRDHRLAGLDHPELRGFWDWYNDLTPAGQAQLVGPALSRLRGVLLRGFASQVIDTTTSSFDLARVLDGQVLLARLPKGTLGEDASRLLGSFIVAKTWQAALARAGHGETARVDASVYIDEFHNFLHPLHTSYEELLAEARGFRLGLTLAHQHLAQLPRDLREAVSANARSKLWFALSPEDAHSLAHHVTPQLTEHDLAHLGAYQAAARLVRDSVELPACTITTRPLPPPVEGRAERLRDAARAHAGRGAVADRQPQARSPEDQVRQPAQRHPAAAPSSSSRR